MRATGVLLCNPLGDDLIRAHRPFRHLAEDLSAAGFPVLRFDFDGTGERREKNTLINDIRRDVAKWRRGAQYPGVTPITRNLLQHWADPNRENRVIFAQRDAAETAIFLTEVAGRTHGYADWRKRLEPPNCAPQLFFHGPRFRGKKFERHRDRV